MEATPPDTAKFAAALCEVEAEIDWSRLEPVYVEGEAAGFFSAEQLGAQRDAGLLFASDLATDLAESAGASLYLGAGVAELAPALFECLGFGRAVHWVTLPGPEAAELARAFETVGERMGERFPQIQTDPLRPAPAPFCDHLWMVSVLSDPVAFPALHRSVYGKKAPRAAALDADRRRARSLLRAAFTHLTPPALVHTTNEELELVRQAASERHGRLVTDELGRLSPIVGDVVRRSRWLITAQV